MNRKILIIDDEKNIVEILKYKLEKEGFSTIEAYDGEQGCELALNEKPDLILLDIMLPKMDGFSVCKKLRLSISTPIIMLTAKEEEVDKVLGLELGADDYITKPFSQRELMARIKANLRRVSPDELAAMNRIIDGHSQVNGLNNGTGQYNNGNNLSNSQSSLYNNHQNNQINNQHNNQLNQLNNQNINLNSNQNINQPNNRHINDNQYQNRNQNLNSNQNQHLNSNQNQHQNNYQNNSQHYNNNQSINSNLYQHKVRNIIQCGDLTIDSDRYEVKRAGEHIDLTLREFELVRFLAVNNGQIFTRENLLEKVWGYEYFGDVRTVDVTVRRIREKLERDPSNVANAQYILTKRGVGYYFDM